MIGRERTSLLHYAHTAYTCTVDVKLYVLSTEGTICYIPLMNTSQTSRRMYVAVGLSYNESMHNLRQFEALLSFSLVI